MHNLIRIEFLRDEINWKRANLRLGLVFLYRAINYVCVCVCEQSRRNNKRTCMQAALRCSSVLPLDTNPNRSTIPRVPSSKMIAKEQIFLRIPLCSGDLQKLIVWIWRLVTFFLLKIWRVSHTFSKRKPRFIHFAPDFFSKNFFVVATLRKFAVLGEKIKHCVTQAHGSVASSTLCAYV